MRTWLGLTLAALILIGPSAAWGTHILTHGMGPEGAASHHGAAQVPHHRGGAPAEPDDQDGGHDHLSGLAFAVAAFFSGPSLPHPPSSASVPVVTTVKTLPRLPSTPPPAEPPRSL